jgi:hypothetical protein
MFVEYKTLFKLQSSYVSVLKKEADKRGFLRGAYKTQQVPTGRLAAGKDSKNTYFSPINLQALPKPHVAMYDVYDLGDRSLFSRKDNILMGYQFVMSKYDEDKKHIIPDDARYIGWAEGMNPKNNIRACITPKMYEDSGEDEFIYVACDYCTSPETLVELKDGTKIPIKELEDKIGIEIKTPFGYHKVNEFHYTGKKQKCILTLKSGKKLVCSPDHRIKVRDVSGNEVWKALKDIDIKSDTVLEDELV